MDRDNETKLETAERHVRQGTERIERQRERIAHLTAAGRVRALQLAQELLEILLTSQEVLEAHLSRVKRDG